MLFSFSSLAAVQAGKTAFPLFALSLFSQLVEIPPSFSLSHSLLQALIASACRGLIVRSVRGVDDVDSPTWETSGFFPPNLTHQALLDWAV